MKRILTFSLLILTLSGCRFESVKHNPSKAVSDTNPFMKALYIDENPQKALELAHPELRNLASADNLGQMVEGIKRQFGGLKRLKVDSYLQTMGRSMELFYVGTYEKGILYHRLVLMGDSSSGYKVSGVWANPDPYPENPLRHKFNESIFVE